VLVSSVQIGRCGQCTRVQTEAVMCNLFSCVSWSFDFIIIILIFSSDPCSLEQHSVFIDDSEHKTGQCVSTISCSVLSHRPSVPTYVSLSFAT
jgi:hypothetical protein